LDHWNGLSSDNNDFIATFLNFQALNIFD